MASWWQGACFLPKFLIFKQTWALAGLSTWVTFTSLRWNHLGRVKNLARWSLSGFWILWAGVRPARLDPWLNAEQSLGPVLLSDARKGSSCKCLSWPHSPTLLLPQQRLQLQWHPTTAWGMENSLPALSLGPRTQKTLEFQHLPASNHSFLISLGHGLVTRARPSGMKSPGVCRGLFLHVGSMEGKTRMMSPGHLLSLHVLNRPSAF